jgi:pimeloyl-ACP methyl ester carboxylesterase
VIGFEVAGNAPPLVLVHGSSGTRLRWAGVGPAPALAPLFETEFSKVSPTAARTVGRELDAVAAHRPPPRLAAIGVPVRLLLGTESPAYLTAATAMVAAHIPGATIVAFQGHGHQGVDDDPDQFTRLAPKFDPEGH